MPWRRKEPRRRSVYWVAAVSVVLLVGIGVLIGYTRWGVTASVVDVVERQLTKTQSQIEVLEKRLGAIEGKLGGAEPDSSPASAWSNLPDHVRANMLQAETSPAKPQQ